MKISIITHYYHNANYGGNLQAYALEEFINSEIDLCECEQLSYRHTILNLMPQSSVRQSGFLKRFVKYIRRNFKKLYYNGILKIPRKLKVREKCIINFNCKKIKHSKEIYTKDNIIQANNQYDVFITGSDQVWNPIWYDENYWLNFVSAEKTKLSYAAGISAKELTERQKQLFSESLKTYDAISVREESSVGLIQPLTKTKVEWVIDPTLLLSSEDWNRICTPRRVAEKYVFCYFLGGIAGYKKIVKRFAKAKKLKIVTLPYLGGALIGENFGDYKLFDVSPADFISLIKNAGGGIAPTGGYICGKGEYIEKIGRRLTAPSIGLEVGSFESGYRYFYQGLFMAPHTVAQALKCSLLIGIALTGLGFKNYPSIDKMPYDITRCIQFDSADKMIDFIREVQYASPVDSYVTCEPWDMPGYDDEIIMAAGTFVSGASIELSADGPVKPPYIAYFQGGLTYEHGKCALRRILEKLEKYN